MHRVARRTVVSAAAAAGLAILSSHPAHASSSTWIAPLTGGFSWADAANWQNSIIPGSTDGASGSSTDIAIFNTPGNGNSGTEVIPDVNRNILGITLDINVGSSTDTSGRVIGVSGTTAPLYVTGGGSIVLTANTNTTSSSTINSPLVALGNSYSILDNSTTSAAGLKVNGGITGGAAGVTTITFDGANSSGVLTSNCQVGGPITDGAATHLAVVKNGTASSVWDFRAASTASNTYSGDTIINGGGLRLNGTGATSPNSNYIVNNTGTLRFSMAGTTAKSLTANAGGVISSSNDTVVTNVATNSGPALTLNETGATGTISFGAPINLTGTTAGQGGVTLINDNNTPKVSWSKNIDLGSVDRIFDIAHSTTNDASGDPDLQLSGVISGNSGLIKTGAGVLKLNNAANSFAGPLEIQAGRVRFNGAEALTAHPNVLVDGGTLDVQSFNQTVGNVTITKGRVAASSTTPGTLTAPSYNLNVAGGDAAIVDAGLLDTTTGPSTVAKAGAGSATLNGSNTYTGVTSVNGGTLTVAPAAATTVLNGAGGANITGGRMVFTYTGPQDNPAAQVQSILTAGRPGNFATGQIRSSAADNNHGLGWSDDGTSKVTVAYAFYGDANLDGRVDTLDFNSLAANFGGTGKVWSQADFNYDGKVDTLDFNNLAANFGQQLPSDSLSGVALVPEPASGLSLLIIGGFAASRTRKRKHS